MLRLFVSILVLYVGQSYGQTIDVADVKSNADVERLMQSFGDRYDKFQVMTIGEIYEKGSGLYKRTADSLGVTKAYYKTDFDQNGFTDLLVMGKSYDFTLYMVMNFGNDSLQLQRLTSGIFTECIYPIFENDTILNLYHFKMLDRMGNVDPNLIKKSLVYKFGTFIERNPEPKEFDIVKIEFRTTPCFGQCPVFELSFNQNGHARLVARSYNRPSREGKLLSGKFKTVLTDSMYIEIVDLLYYLDFPNLEDRYSVNWTDDQSSWLKITYNKGEVKEINDYGLAGTYGLRQLYRLLFDLRFNQDWDKKL